MGTHPNKKRAATRTNAGLRPDQAAKVQTKLATTRWWHTTTLAQDFGVADADEDDLYAAMDWLLARQAAIQKKLAVQIGRASCRERVCT